MNTIMKCIQDNWSRISIEVEVEEHLKYGDVLKTIFEDKSRFFKIEKIEVDKFNCIAIAKEYGYYNILGESNYNLKHLLGRTVNLVTNPIVLQQLKEEDCYI